MKFRLLLIAFAFCLLAIASGSSGKTENNRAQKMPQREIAITFDDLPEAPPGVHNLKALEEINRRLVKSIVAAGVPAIGFVNEGKLYRNAGREVAARSALLKIWTDAGLELGNHTYSHVDLFTTPLDSSKADLLKGEPVTKKLLAEKGKKIRYFRHPYLNTGPSLEAKTAFENFLTEHGYKVAPVTVDNQDYVFAAVYAEAMAKNNQAMMERVGEAYVPYLAAMLDFFEQQSASLFGYEVKQTLLLHGNALNADYFDELVGMMKGRGYKFISLDEALTDKAYNSADTYTGRSGMSWLQRWAITRDHKPTKALFKQEPAVPDFVQKAFEQRGNR